jgi:hypothetical protein
MAASYKSLNVSLSPRAAKENPENSEHAIRTDQRITRAGDLILDRSVLANGLFKQGPMLNVGIERISSSASGTAPLAAE